MLLKVDWYGGLLLSALFSRFHARNDLAQSSSCFGHRLIQFGLIQQLHLVKIQPIALPYDVLFSLDGFPKHQDQGAEAEHTAFNHCHVALIAPSERTRPNQINDYQGDVEN